MDIIEKVKEVAKLLDEIDEYCDNMPNLQSNDDMIISDWYHYIELNKHDTKTAYRIVKYLKEDLKNRRFNKCQLELCRTYKTHINKLINKGNREMLINELVKREREITKPYVYRVYDEDKINEMLGITPSVTIGDDNENNNQQYNLD